MDWGQKSFTVRRLFIALLRRFMNNSPPDVDGLLCSPGSRVRTVDWQKLLRDHSGSYDTASQWFLAQMTFCKSKHGKKHEFLLFQFHHPTHPAHPTVVVDREPEPSQHHSNGSAIVSPSSSPPVPAHDTVHIVDRRIALSNYLRQTYTEWDELYLLDFLQHPNADSSSSSNPLLGARFPLPGTPSVLQVCILLRMISHHSPNYELFQMQCYWFAHTVWEAVRALWGGVEMPLPKHQRRGQYNGLQIDRQDSVAAVCDEYQAEWKRMENEAVQRQREFDDRLAKEVDRRVEEVQKRLAEAEDEVRGLKAAMAAQGTLN